MNRLALFYSFVLLPVLYACNDPEPQESYQITGYVYSAGKVSGNADVTLAGSTNISTRTDATGYFEFHHVPIGDYDLNIRQTNVDGSFVEQNKSISVIGNLNLDSLLLPNPVVLFDVHYVNPQLANNGARLSWTPSYASDFREYKIYRGTTPGLDEATGELIYVTTSREDTVFEDRVSYDSQYYYRVFVMNAFGRLGGSNLQVGETTSFENDMGDLQVGVIRELRFQSDDVFELSFNASAGTIYKISWFDSYLRGDEVPDSIGIYDGTFTTECHSDTRIFFDETSNMPMTGGPRLIVATVSEKVTLKFKTIASGSMAILIDSIPLQNVTPLTFNSVIDISNAVQQHYLFEFDAAASGKYKITSYNNGVVLGTPSTLSVVGSSSGEIYINSQSFPFQEFAATGVMDVSSAETVYVLISSAYFGRNNHIYFQLEPQ